MKHIKIYENFVSNVNESSIPVYDDTAFNKTGGEPEMNVSPLKAIAVIQDLLDQKAMGEVDEVTVVAEIPTQGKTKPSYVDEIISKAKEEAALKYRRETGIDIEKAAPSDIERAGVMQDVFFDSEFIVDRIDKSADGTFIVCYPQSLSAKAKTNPAPYSVYLKPEHIEEVHYSY